MQSESLARVDVTVVATRGSEIHVFAGKLSREDAISLARKEKEYPDGTVFIVFGRDVDVTKPRETAESINMAVKQMKAMVFKENIS